MGVRRFPDIMNKLVEHGRAADTPIAIVERGTTSEQRIVRGTLGQLTMISEAHRICSPAVLFVGDVTRTHDPRSCADFPESVGHVATLENVVDSLLKESVEKRESARL